MTRDCILLCVIFLAGCGSSPPSLVVAVNAGVEGDALKAAANRTLDYVPRAYIDRNENLDVQRDLGENLAQETLSKDVNPQPHFASADLARSKAQWFLFVLIWFGVALVLLTMADAIQNPLRYALLAGGLCIFVFGTITAAVIESIAGRM